MLFDIALSDKIDDKIDKAFIALDNIQEARQVSKDNSKIFCDVKFFEAKYIYIWILTRL